MASESYPLRLDQTLLKKAQKQAELEHRSLASLIRHALALYLAKKRTA